MPVDIRRYMVRTGEENATNSRSSVGSRTNAMPEHGNAVDPRASHPEHVGNHVSRKRPRPEDLVMPTHPVKRRILTCSVEELNRSRALLYDWLLELYTTDALVSSSTDQPITWQPRVNDSLLAGCLQRHKVELPMQRHEMAKPIIIPEVSVASDGAAGRPPVELSHYKTAALPSRPHSLQYDGNQELIAERVKQEAYVAQRIAELQREGLWAEKRLPKVQEPPRNKAHWDYLLEEMQWLSADFAQERKWKKANAKKCAKMVQKYFQDKESLQRKEEKSQELKLRRIANFMAKEVKNFWSNVNKLVEYKQTTRLDEKRKRALDQHLSFIVDQTERYSTLLAESMNKPGTSTSRPDSPRTTTTTGHSDDEFQPDLSSSDDEATIAKDEDERDADEVDRLRKESELPLDDLLDQLPKDYFLNRDKDLDSMSTKSEDITVDDDVDKKGSKRKSVHTEQESENESESEDSEVTESEKDSDGSPEDDISLKTLIDSKLNQDDDQDGADKEMNDVAALAASIQPKGSTLLTANVATKVPFLIKHCLREYQHIGLDWLVTMFDRKFNGILADEMGLGKTIQTIALLTHLACDKGNWGPHLIVVPTSVMLNWEMEFKKWCPAFKILTYYGSIRDRKAKRTGWTKDNAFHICITSYKLVIQDHASFRRKKWQYLVLDEAQNIKNFRSQRWQLLLNFQTARRLLLTGTPLQNNLMELWSLMHFLMPDVFQSHREFKEWFSNPVTGMLEGNSEYNENIIKRLHKVLRPFLLRRLKTEVEKQLPKKYEHVVMCRLSKRQRYLYDDFMSRAKTKETLASGNLLSVINVLMQLRKVCNHPNLFESRPVISPFHMDGIVYQTASLATKALDYHPLKHVSLDYLNLRLVNAEKMSSLDAYMTQQLQTSRRYIEELDSVSFAEVPRPPKITASLHLAVHNRVKYNETPVSAVLKSKNAARLAAIKPADVGRSPSICIKDSASCLKSTGSGVHFLPSKAASQLPTTTHLVQTGAGRRMYFSTTQQSVIANGQRLAQGNPSLQSTDLPASSQHVKNELSVFVRRLDPSAMVTAVEPPVPSPNPLHPPPMEVVEERRRVRRLARLRSLAEVHNRRCAKYPIYGTELVHALRVVDQPPAVLSPAAWRWAGTAACYSVASARLKPQDRLWCCTDALQEAIKSPEKLVQSLHDVISRFMVYVPAVTTSRIGMHVSHPTPSHFWREKRTVATIERRLAPKCRILHPIVRSLATQFPDPRLIQYDCGKLQVLDRLLRQLKMDRHKVLMFTQMTRMLDVLEAFLNYHGYIYLRLDGTTKVEMRQVLMERFNTDDRIFIFILSTRSGGIGVNLTGADTVIFYDSDWNPTMDAQAQDRCHRIGQTRDVHIYRLVSEMTVEENILKKANQKRMLGDLAIEGGNFTTAYFKSQSTIQDLFNVDMSETDASKRMQQTLGAEREKITTDEPEHMSGELTALESALATAEDATDVEAARTAAAEADAELAEFDENIPIEEPPEAEAEVSRVEHEISQLVDQLKPIERYAMRYVEENDAAWSAEQMAAAEAQIEEQKKEWEQNRLSAIEAEEARRRDEGETQEELTYSRRPNNEEWLNERSINGLTMWCPPTPPQELNDVYVDVNLNMLYSDVPINDSNLPPVFVKKELKRSRTSDLVNNIDIRRSQKLSRRDDSPTNSPRSLFDHPVSALQKMRRDVKMQKYRGLGRQGSVPGVVSPRYAAPGADNGQDWTVHEDWALLQAVEQLQELPLDLVVHKPGHLPNWDLVADNVNMISCTTRSPTQCRNRFEAVIIPREEGKIIYDQKKQKKNKNLYKLPIQKSSRALRTNQLNIQDNNAGFTEALHQRFDNIKGLVLTRKPNPKPLLVNPTLKNPKHFAVLTESGISYDFPLNPIDIATRRADRIAKDKKVQMAQAAAALQPAQAGTSHAIPAEQSPQRQLVVTASKAHVQNTSAASSPQTVSVSLSSGITTAQVIGTVSAAGVQVASTVAAVTPTQSIVVASATPITSTHLTATISTGATGLRQARPATTLPVGIQEMVVAAANQSRALSGTGTNTTVVSVANLARSLVTIPTSVVKGAGVQVPTKTLSAGQMNFFRQHAMMRPPQRIGVREPGGQVKVVQGGPSKMTQGALVQPVSPAQQAKTQYLKGATALTTKGRTEEVAALMKQSIQRQQKAQNPQHAQLTAQFQVPGPAQMATLVKASAVQSVTIPSIVGTQVKGTLGSQLKTATVAAAGHPMRLTNYQQLLNNKNRQGKMTQLNKQTAPTLIMQGAGRPTINLQHIHQVIKNSQPQHITVAAGQGISGGQMVIAKATTASVSGLGSRVLPGVAGTRQTIQVVPGPIRNVTGVAQVSGSTLKVGTSQPAFISQVTGIPNIVRQGTGTPVRIQTAGSGTPIMAVTVQQQHNQQTDQGQS